MVEKIIQPFLQQKIQGNAHIFVNSVDFIAKVIEAANLLPDDVKIVCSSDNLNQKKLSEAYPVCKPLDPVKKINFYTSTCFEGSDIYDTEGRTYIVSDKKRQHTLLDISTLVIQICGRIRNSRYNDTVTHVFSGYKYNTVNLDEYKTICLDKYAQSIAFANKLNSSLSESERLKLDRMTNNLGNEYMIFKENNTFGVDENLLNLDIVNFKIHQLVYQDKITVAGEYQKQGFEITPSNYKYYGDKLMADSKAKISFRDLFLQYADLHSNPFYRCFPDVKLIEKERHLIKEAYDILGVERVAQLKYHQGNIKKEIYKQTDETNLWKTKKMIMEQIGFFRQIEVSKAKRILSDIYSELGIRRRAKATDLNKLFYVKTINKNSVRYLELISSKVVENENNI